MRASFALMVNQSQSSRGARVVVMLGWRMSSAEQKQQFTVKRARAYMKDGSSVGLVGKISMVRC